MSFYTSILIYPVDKKFVPSPDQLRSIASYMEIRKIDSVSVSPRIPFYLKLKRWLFPQIIESYPLVPDLAYEHDVTLERALELLKHPKAFKSHFMPKCEGWCKRVAQEINESVPRSISDSFDGPHYLPWDTGFQIGPWEEHDYMTGKVIARGSFAISKSGNTYPKDLDVYLEAFMKVDSIRKLIQFLEQTSSVKWTSVISMG